MDTLSNKTVLITGGASGIGLGMARAFLEQDATVVVADIDEKNLAEARNDLTRDFSRVEFVELDVADDESWAQVTDDVWSRHGGIDVLVNNAGVGQGVLQSGKQAHGWEIPAATRDLVLDVNVAGVLRGVQHVIPRMIERGQGGHVVTTASLSGLFAVPGISLYSASKFAVVGYSEALAGELVPYGIGVSILCPGSVKSNLKAAAARRNASNDTKDVEGYVEDLDKKRSAKMDPLHVGRRTVAAVLDEALYVVTHPNYLESVQRRHRRVETSFGEPAQPGYTETDDIVAAVHNPAYEPDGTADNKSSSASTPRRGLIITRADVAPEHEDEFNRWLDLEHIPERAGCPGFLSARRFRTIDGEPKYLAIYELEDLGVLDTEAYQAMRGASEWQKKIVPYVTHSSRQVLEEITRPVPTKEQVVAVRN